MNRPMTVAQLASYLKCVFEDEELLHDVTLTGEVTDISYSDKHTFLTLADDKYSVRCVHFLSRDGIEKGMRVALKGSVSFYDKRNSISFNYTEFFTSGVGDKNVRLEQLKTKLSNLGYFENRPQLPKYITDVVVVTSAEGAAIRDFMRVVYDKCPFVNIRVVNVRVQGENAATMIAKAVNDLQRIKTDAIVICRGGGSDEDLDCFNDENLAVAVAESRIPIISAVGHEINYSLCDYCAGTRAGTPSIAGEIVNSHAERILNDIGGAMLRIKAVVAQKFSDRLRNVGRLGNATVNAVTARINGGHNAVRRYSDRANFALQRKLDVKIGQLVNISTALRGGVLKRYSDGENKYKVCKAKLTALDPHRIIKIGYAAVLGDSGRIVGAEQLSKGQSVKLVFADGVAAANITEVKRERRD